MNRWKASLGLNGGDPIHEANDPRKCIIKSLALKVEGRPDVVIDLSTPGSVDSLKDKPFTIKEGAKFHIKVTFQVHHEVLSGLKYLQVVKRKGIRVSKDEEMLGSYAPSTTTKPVYEKECKWIIISFVEFFWVWTIADSILQSTRRRPPQA
jgi:Rho GDP-dissociation inhibitor